jgi:hypothetical protein
LATERTISQLDHQGSNGPTGSFIAMPVALDQLGEAFARTMRVDPRGGVHMVISCRV